MEPGEAVRRQEDYAGAVHLGERLPCAGRTSWCFIGRGQVICVLTNRGMALLLQTPLAFTVVQRPIAEGARLKREENHPKCWWRSEHRME